MTVCTAMDRILSAITYPSIDPVIVQLGPLALRWYGLAFVLGFVAAGLLLRQMIRSRRLRMTTDRLSDLMMWLVAGVLVGGRLGWWLFYHRSDGAAEPWYAPLAIWEGGMSFHGGLAGVAVALLSWSRLRRAPLWNIADALALVAPIGLFFGRIANFINGELVGRPTDLPWGVIFPGDSFARHPSQLYEAILEGPVLLLVLWWFARRRPAAGSVAAMFLIFYGLFRFAVEFTRQPDEQLGFIALGWLTMGQLLSAALATAGLVLLAVHRPGAIRSGTSSTGRMVEPSPGGPSFRMQ
jgi:phosphatidylglycerol---prolipoprotein diacylglyceryl transferase